MNSESVLAYASGTNRSCEILGALKAGVPIGVDVSKISDSAVQLLQANTDVPIFADNGAFAEVSWLRGTIQLVKPISDESWHRRLGTCVRLAKAAARTGCRHPVPLVSVVAPDRVGDQFTTIARLQIYRGFLRQLFELGADIILPLQCGGMNMRQFYDEASRILGWQPVPAIPMNKAPQAVENILTFLQANSVKRIHLLGLGLSNRATGAIIEQIHKICAQLTITLDSNRIRAAVGRGRSITRREQTFTEEFLSHATGEVELREWGGGVCDFTELIGSPSEWLHKPNEFSQTLTWLDDDQKASFAADPDRFVQANDIDDWTWQWLTEEYLSYVRKSARRAARCKAVALSLSGNL